MPNGLMAIYSVPSKLTTRDFALVILKNLKIQRFFLYCFFSKWEQIVKISCLFVDVFITTEGIDSEKFYSLSSESLTAI